jgi:O-antigen/teichoic acid export membrane protein
MDKAILKNVAVNFTGLILPTFISLVTVPSYIRLLGVDRYGVVSLVWTFIGYFSVLDFGMSIATENQIAKIRELGDPHETARVFWSAFWLNLATGVLGGLVIYFGSVIYTQYFSSVPVAMRQEIIRSMPWLAIAVPIANVSWVCAGALSGMEKFAAYNTNQTIGTFVFQLLPLGAILWLGATLPVALAAAVVARFIGGALLARATWSALELKQVLMPEIKMIKQLFSYGGWVLVAGSIGMVADSLDRVLLGAMTSARFVTFYTVPQNLVTRLNMLPSAFARTLFPRLSSVNREQADDVVERSLTFLNGVFTPIALFTMFAIGPFLHVWVGHDLTVSSAPVGRILIIGIWMVGQTTVTKILIQSQSDPIKVARVNLIELPILAVMLWFGITYFGMMGAAVAVVIRCLIDYAIFLKVSEVRMRPVAVDMTPHLIFLVASVLLCNWLTNLLPLILWCAVMVLANMAWSLCSAPELRSLFMSAFTRLNFRKKSV